MVVVVDDDEDLLEMFGLLFDRAKIPCLRASSVAALKLHADKLSPVKLALLDVNLGAGKPSGVDAAAWLRTQGYAMRIVFITGHAPEHPLVRAAAGNQGEVLAKPVSTRILLELARQT